MAEKNPVNVQKHFHNYKFLIKDEKLTKDSQTPKFKRNIFSGSLSPNFQIDASEKPEEILETPNTDAEYSAN